MPLIANLTELPIEIRKKVAEICTNEFTVQAQMAKIRQQKIAKFHADHQGRAIEGMGGQEMAIDPWLVSYFQQQHHTSFWSDMDFREWLKKRFDFVRVKTGGTKIQVGFSGVAAAATKKRYSKTFSGN